MSLIPRIHSPHTRDPVDKCSSPLSSAIIMIVIVSRGIKAEAKINFVTSQSKPQVDTTCLLKQWCQPPYATHPSATHLLLGLLFGYLPVPTLTPHAVAWNRAAPGARRKPTRQLIKEGFGKLEYTQ